MTTTKWIALLVAAILTAGVGEAADRAAPPGPDERALVQAINELGFDLYAQLRARDGNLFLSPYSISTALAMTYAGARGPTATEMAKVLRLPFKEGRVHRAFGKVNRDVIRDGLPHQTEIHVANALWVQAGLPVRTDFRTVATNLYGAGLTPLDFQRAPEQARGTINTWVEQRTQDRIKDLVPEGLLTPATRLVLTNAIYFKSVWMRPFPEAATRKDTFTLSTGDKVDVPLMQGRAAAGYLDGRDFQALALPFEAHELSMIVLLPKAVDGLAALERTLTAARLEEWLAGMTMYDMDLVLPRFKVAAEFPLGKELIDLGMPLAFSNRADFSGILTGERISISAVIHKAFVDVSEKGAEAAAATGMVKHTISGREPMPRAAFRADHPFWFAIRDTDTGSLLFVGRVTNPQAK